MTSTTTSSQSAMDEIYASLSIEEEDEGGLIIEGDDVEDGKDGKIDFRFCLVGRFLTDKVINFPAMKNTMAALWRPGKGICIKDLTPTLFLFQFFHEIDIQRVIDSGPWTFDQHILIAKRLGESEQPQMVPLYHTSFWIQVYNLPIGFLSEKVLQNIGNYIGEFQASDENNLMGVWRNYMRIRVSLDVRKPLKRRMKLKKTRSEWIWIDFKYERLHVFCFICGLLGHTEKQCPSLYDCHASTITKPYGQWMKAPTRRNNMNSGEKWLRSVPLEVGEGKYGNCMESVNDMSIDSMHPIKSGIANLRSNEGGEKDGSVPLNKASHLLVPAKSQLTSKGKEVIGTGPTKEGDEDFELGLVVVENKRRRSKLELEENSELQSDTSHMMEIGLFQKNGLEVGSVNRAHRTQ